VGQITLVQVAVLLAAAGLVAPLAKHFRIGAVLGYLFAGMVIGPFGCASFLMPTGCCTWPNSVWCCCSS
jgi:glutathione-regulated potassium-efflux system protein KefB